MSSKSRIVERPIFAPHVVATYDARESKPDGGWEPQRIELVCETCKTEAKVICETGAVRRHIHAFAVAHLHRDVLG